MRIMGCMAVQVTRKPSGDVPPVAMILTPIIAVVIVINANTTTQAIIQILRITCKNPSIVRLEMEMLLDFGAVIHVPMTGTTSNPMLFIAWLALLTIEAIFKIPLICYSNISESAEVLKGINRKKTFHIVEKSNAKVQ